MKENAQIVDEAELKDKKLTKCRAVMYPDEEALEDVASRGNKFEDNEPNKSSVNNQNVENFLNEHTTFDPLKVIKAEETVVEHEPGNENNDFMNNTDPIVAISVRRQLTEELNDDGIEQLNNEDRYEAESSESKFYNEKLLQHGMKFNCKYCEFTSAYKRCVKRHTDAVHLKLKPFNCKYCDYTCLMRVDMKKHTESVHMKLKPFKCDYCEYTSSERGRMKFHTNAVHFKLRPHKCEYCNFTASQRSALKKHFKSVHMKAHSELVPMKLKPFKCEYCDYTSSQSESLNKHTESVHMASKYFPSSQSIEMNSNDANSEINFIDCSNNSSHEERKPFICVECDSIFCEKESLLSHMESCNSSFNYNCSQCLLSFSDQKSLTDHQKKNHMKDQESFNMIKMEIKIECSDDDFGFEEHNL